MVVVLERGDDSPSSKGEKLGMKERKLTPLENENEENERRIFSPNTIFVLLRGGAITKRTGKYI